MLSNIFRKLLPHSKTFAGKSNGNHNGNHHQQTDTTSLLPFLIFKDRTCVPVTQMEEDTLLIFHPKDNKLLLRLVPGQEESHGFSMGPRLSDPELFKDMTLQTYHQALVDPLLRSFPYVLETYRILEACYRRPAYRISQNAGSPDEGYLLKFYCHNAIGSICGQITCRVIFFQNRVLFSSPVMTDLKAAVRQVIMLKAPQPLAPMEEFVS
jgi:hypothetical protein